MNDTCNKFNSQENYWDSVAEIKEFTTPFQFDLFKKYVSANMKILDVGCGYGRTLHELHEYNYENCTGIDFSQEMINRGLKIYPLLNLMKNNNDVLPFQNKSFDAAILISVLTCIVKNEDQKKLISEILKVLSDDGIIYINDFIINNDKRNIERYKSYQEKYGEYGVFELPEGAIVRHHSQEHILNILNDFITIYYESNVYTTMNGNTSNGFIYLGKKRAAMPGGM
jgi:ubiquinone/menaquinone biosynthesis C-methylase UbiE